MTIGDRRPRYGWQFRGTRGTAPVTLSRRKMHVFGALGDGEFYFRFYDWQDSKAFLSFLRYLHHRFGPVLVFADNASWHRSAAVRDGLREFNGEVKLMYYPPHTPELNSAEPQWNVMRNAIGNRVYGDTREMARSIRTMIRKKVIFPVKLSDYLVR